MCSNCKASVMIYDDAERKWKSAGRTPGLSNVNVYRHMVQNTFRVVGRKEQDGEVRVNFYKDCTQCFFKHYFCVFVYTVEFAYIDTSRG